jgi:predicted membrane protein
MLPSSLILISLAIGSLIPALSTHPFRFIILLFAPRFFFLHKGDNRFLLVQTHNCFAWLVHVVLLLYLVLSRTLILFASSSNFYLKESRPHAYLMHPNFISAFPNYCILFPKPLPNGPYLKLN